MSFLDSFGSAPSPQGGSFLSGFGSSTAASPSPFLSAFKTQSTTPPVAEPSSFAHTAISTVGNVLRNIFSGPVERVGAIAQSIKTGSLAPLQQSFSNQFDKLSPPAPNFSLLKTGTPQEKATEQAKLAVWEHSLGNLVMGFVNPGEGAGVPSNPLENNLGNSAPKAGEPPIELPTPGAPTETPSIPDLSASSGAKPAADAIPELSSPNATTPNLGVNSDTLNIAPESKQLLDNLSQDLSPKTATKIGRTMSNQEVIDFAKANPNLTVNQVSRDASLKANAAMLQARQTLAAQMTALQNGTADTADKADIIKNFFAVKTSLTDTARALQSAGIKADPSEASTVSNILSKIYAVNKNIDEISAAAKNVDFNNYNQVVSFYRQFVKPTAADWLDVVRYNSMLSSPLTLSNISAGNAFNLVAQPIVKSTAGALDWLKTGVFGGEQTHFIGEGPAYVKGAAQNVGEAFQNMTDVLTGNLDPKMLDFNVPIAAEGTKGTVVKAMNIFSTLHNAMYQFFNTIAKGGSEASLAYKADQGVATPLADMAAQAEADYATFRAGTLPEGQGNVLNAIDSIANAFKQWSASDNPALAWPTKFTLPFLRISTNMAKQMVEYSPAGFSTMAGAADPLTQFAKASLGTVAFATIGTLAATGNITGAAPTNPADKTAFLASGRQAYSIKIGNTWISYNKLPPAFSIPMLLAASYMQSQATGVGKDKLQSVLDAFGAFGKYIADQSYVKNIGDLVAAVQGDTSKGNPLETLITNDAQQLLPFRAFSGWLAKLMDPNQRQIDSSAGAITKQVQLFMEQIPGLRQEVPAKLDAAGNPIPNQNRILNAVSPFQKSQTSPQKEQTFQNTQDLKQASSDQAAVSKDLTSQAQAAITHIQSLQSVDDKKTYLTSLATSNPDLAKKVIDVLKSNVKTQGLSADEQKLLKASTSSKAQFIQQKLGTLQTIDEKKAYLTDLASKGLLTKDVLKSIATGVKTPPPQTSKSISGRISAYFSAVTTNPVQAFHDIFSGQTISGTKNGAVLVDRMSLKDSEAIKKSLLPAGANPADYQLDHTVPLELGGTNDKSNLKLIPIEQAHAADQIENYLGDALAAKTITANKAVQLMLDFKNGKLSSDDVHNQVQGGAKITP